MPFQFTNQEYADIHFIYGYCNGNSEEAVREYARRFPNRRHPNRRVFIRVHQHFREHGLGGIGNGIPEYGGRRRIDIRRDRQVLDLFDEDGSLSTRRGSRLLNIAKTTIWKTLKRHHYLPFHLQPVQHLHAEDPERRLAFCRSFLNLVAEDPHFCSKVLWTDESYFTRRGVVNFHNMHQWAINNPHAIRPRNFQVEFGVNVWMGVVGDFVLGPIILPNRLNGQSFLQFLNNELLDAMDDIPLHLRREIYFQLDGCPAHYFRGVRNWLNTNYPNRWIGRGGPMAWPPRSPDITPLDFFVWGYIKSQVYATPVASREDLIQRIENVSRTITQDHLSNMRQSITRRCQLCIAQNGHEFEQLL